MCVSLRVAQSTLASTSRHVYTEMAPAVLHCVCSTPDASTFTAHLFPWRTPLWVTQSVRIPPSRKCVTAHSEGSMDSVWNDSVSGSHLLASSTWDVYFRPPPPNEAAYSPARDGPPGQPGILLHQTTNRSVRLLGSAGAQTLPPWRTQILRDPPARLWISGRQGGTGASPVYTRQCLPCALYAE